MVIAFLPGPDLRLLGRSAQARNRRVAERVGATIVTAEALPSTAEDVAIVVPADVAISAVLFKDQRFIDACRASLAGERTPVWAASSPGAAVLVGAPDRLRPIVSAIGIAAGAGLTSAGEHFGRVQVDADGILEIASRADRAQASWRIVQRTGKATDGWVARNFNRPLSRPMSYALLGLGLNANHASLVTLLFGFAAAGIAAAAGYWPLLITGVMFQFASVLDGVDGEMARATLTESESGARLDTIVDQLTYVTCFIGVMIGWVREGGAQSALLWTVGLSLALVFSLARAGRFVARYAENASFVFIDRSIRRAANDTGLATLKMAAAAFTLLRRDVFAAIFLVVSLTGFRVLIPALIAWGIVVANFTFSFHRRELADAARAERLPATS
jgi:phosphatidylglycerophosphate synthase